MTGGRPEPTIANGLGITVYGCERDEAVLFRRLGPQFGIVPTITRDAVSESSVDFARGHRGVSVGHKSTVSRAALRALREVGVEYVSTRSIGLDHIDVHAADAMGITVENVVYAPDGVADFTVMLILMAIRNARALVGSANDHDLGLGRVRGRDLRDLTVGVVGAGNIGSAVIARLQGFGCRVLACNNGRAAAAAAAFVPLPHLLRESDIVTLHVPLNGETHHLIGAEQLGAMKPGAVLVNTGRGALVDTDALIGALERGTLGGAALDVLEREDGIFSRDSAPSAIAGSWLSRLQRLPTVIVTPHIAYYTARMLREIVEQTLGNCLTFERNRARAETEDRDLVRGLLGGA